MFSCLFDQLNTRYTNGKYRRWLRLFYLFQSNVQGSNWDKPNKNSSRTAAKKTTTTELRRSRKNFSMSTFCMNRGIQKTSEISENQVEVIKNWVKNHQWYTVTIKKLNLRKKTFFKKDRFYIKLLRILYQWWYTGKMFKKH